MHSVHLISLVCLLGALLLGAASDAAPERHLRAGTEGTVSTAAAAASCSELDAFGSFDSNDQQFASNNHSLLFFDVLAASDIVVNSISLMFKGPMTNRSDPSAPNSTVAIFFKPAPHAEYCASQNLPIPCPGFLTGSGWRRLPAVYVGKTRGLSTFRFQQTVYAGVRSAFYVNSGITWGARFSALPYYQSRRVEPGQVTDGTLQLLPASSINPGITNVTFPRYFSGLIGYCVSSAPRPPSQPPAPPVPPAQPEQPAAPAPEPEPAPPAPPDAPPRPPPVQGFRVDAFTEADIRGAAERSALTGAPATVVVRNNLLLTREIFVGAGASLTLEGAPGDCAGAPAEKRSTVCRLPAAHAMSACFLPLAATPA